MTVEELKSTAKSLGYSIVPIQTYVRLIPCKCGKKHITQWLSGVNIFYQCDECGLRGEFSRVNRQARLNWNKAVGG